MRKTLVILPLLLLLSAPVSGPDEQAIESIEYQLSDFQAGLFGWVKPKYKIKKIQRQNSPKSKNRRNKKLLKKWGLAMVEWKEVSNG